MRVFDAEKIQRLIREKLADHPLASLMDANGQELVGGKMLRARLLQALASVLGVSEEDTLRMAAAVELVHGASLLHDDVIDGAVLRRGQPSFWKTHGVNGAVLLGDTLVFEALDLLKPVGNAALLPLMVEFGREVCQAEISQELLWRGEAGSWSQCLQIARGKTGALFAFAACAPAYADPELQQALKEAGYLLGTAYQLYDDLQDEASESKTAGTDQARGKITATTVPDAPEDLAAAIRKLLEQSKEGLCPWPQVERVWETYLNETMRLLF